MKNCALAILLLCMLSTPSYAEGILREKIKDRFQGRIVEKLESAPTPEANASVKDTITRAGDYTFSIQQNGLTRMYLVHVPTRYTPANASPLLLAFHGGGGDMNYMARDAYYGLISKSNKEGFVLIFPNGYSKLPSGKFATWNAGNCCGDARDKNIDDVSFVKTIINNISNQMNIDKNRIFATGMSNGGMMAQRLACEMPGTFAAIASVAGTNNTKACTPTQPISVLHIHARNDDHVLYNGGAGKGAFKDQSKVTNFTSVPATIKNWVTRDRCNATPKQVLNVKGATCELYTGCADGVEVKLCSTDTGRHSWPGGYKPRGDEQPSKAISANDVIWDFFMKQKYKN